MTQPAQLRAVPADRTYVARVEGTEDPAPLREINNLPADRPPVDWVPPCSITFPDGERSVLIGPQ